MAGHTFSRIIAASVLTACFLLSGCGSEKAPAEPMEVCGVADLETLVKGHPSYVDYFRLQNEYEDLLHRYQKERNHLLELSAARKRIQDVLASADQKRIAEDEYSAKVKLRENELNQELKDLYLEINERHQTPFARPELAGDDSADNTKIANLHLKLKFLNLQSEEKEEAQKELEDLLNGRYASIPQDNWTEEEKSEFARRIEDAKGELEAYASQVAKEIMERQQRERAIAASAGLPDPDRWNQLWEERIKDKQKEMAEVKEKIMEDIREKAAIVGEKKHLDIIFTSYQVNLKAEDVTVDIVNELASNK